MVIFQRISPQISRRALISLALLSLLLPQSAQAAMSAADGKRLKTLMNEMIERSRAQSKSQGGDLLTEGEVMVEPGDNYYAITLPHITTVQSDKSKINLGMISINAVPGDKKEEWKMTVALPTPITMYDETGKEDGVLEIGSQNFAGIFHEEFLNFVRLNGQYKNITFTDPTDGSKITIPEFTLMYDLKEGSNKLWSGPMNAKATNVLGSFNGCVAKIASIDIQSTLKDYSIVEAKAYQDKMAAFLESTGADTPSFSGQHIQGMYNTMFDYLTKAWDGFGSTITVNGIEISSAPQPGKPANNVKIARIGFGLDGSGFRSNKVMLHPTLNMTDLTITPEPTGLNKAMPTTVNLDMTFNNVPLKELSELGEKSLAQSMQTPEGSSMAAIAAMASAQQILTNAGTSLTVKDTRVANARDYDILLNGTAHANIKAVMGATAKTRLEIFGIEKLIAYAQHASADPTLAPEKKAKAQQMVQHLTLLQMLGQQGKNAKGQDIRSYDLELTAEGKTLLNGADLATVMGGLKPTP